MRQRIITIAMLMALALPAQAGGFSIEFSAQLTPGRDFEPGTYLVAGRGTPVDMVGQECTVILTTTNDDSIHDTDLVVISDGDSVTFTDVEGEGGYDAVHPDTLTLGQSTEIGIVIPGGPGGGSSIVGSVAFDCFEETTTTTVPDTTTTVPETTTTTVPETTTTVPDTTTTVPETTTTVPSTTTPSTTPDTLPLTGVDPSAPATVALVGFVVGSVLAIIARKSRGA